MATAEELSAAIESLRAAMFSGVRTTTVTFGQRSTTTSYGSWADMSAALARLEADLAALGDPAPSRPRQHLAYQAGSGF